MNKPIIYGLLTTLAAFFFTACVEENEYPDEPHIEYESFSTTANDSVGIIKLSFTDGNGDIGLAKSDTTSPYTGKYFYNFFLYVFEKKNGQYDSVQTSIPFHGRIPILDDVTVGESIEGDIEMEIDIYTMDIFIPGDTLVFDIFIVDRALNQSNTIRTDPIILNNF